MVESIRNDVGVILKGVGGKYTVLAEDGKRHDLVIRGRFRKEKISPLPGDKVKFSINEKEEAINKILPRTNELIRPQVANVTKVFLVFALKNPDINWDLVNTFLIYMERKDIKPVLIFNKIDLTSIEQQEDIKNSFRNTNYKMLFISAKDNGDYIDVLKGLLKDNLTVLAGPSGSGKSTLINSISGRKLMETGEVSLKIGRGKHTTRHTELMEIEGGLLADTPGFSNMEIENSNPSLLVNLFPEMESFIGECRWQGCSHVKEEDCAIKEQVGKSISPERYDFYVRTYNKLKEGEKRKWD